ncbi:hypothetical protein GCM10010300_52180 [Streptomyces olivaceoviridis]|uniref:hypothetical protein n=1 Tax=Streptomyces olivaceoviridis TaxID=1921 RepID=UPI0016725AF0|nr:hypothetical protein [Streptomyces olivaceoviridis]GGZ01718.1 hypothetical protein GCM10010300_52180 [Streptomyces olivaceoviridis]
MSEHLPSDASGHSESSRSPGGAPYPHPLIERLEQAGALGKHVTTVVGFLGKTQNGKARIYLDLSLTTYCEVPADAIVMVAPVDDADDTSPQLIWLESTAQVRLVNTAEISAEAQYISGGIRDRYFESALRLTTALTNRGDVTALRDSGTVWCRPIRTLEGPCETRNIFCPPR